MSENQFIQDGYELYPQAALAAATFRAAMVGRLKSVLKARSKWGRFAPSGGARGDSGGDLEVGWFICVTQPGRVGRDKATVEVGYLWNPPFEGRAPVLYSKFFAGPKRLMQFPYDGAVNEVKAVTAWEASTLVSSMPKDLDPRRIVGLQLDMLVKVMNGG